MIIKEEDLLHYGIIRRSGRYPWGSGGNYAGMQSKSENVRNKTFLQYVDDMRKEGMSEVEIAKGLGTSTGQLRAARTAALAQQKSAKQAQARTLADKGLSGNAIAERMGLPGESSVRALLKSDADQKQNILTNTVDLLKSEVDEKTFLDVGRGQENHIGISKEKLRTAVGVLKAEGYNVYYPKVPQITGDKETSLMILGPPGSTWTEAADAARAAKIGQIAKWSDDGGISYEGFQTPIAVNPNRVQVIYAEQGGDKADGVIYVRPGVDDVSLGSNRYAQVRIQVGDEKYLKGMAMYKDDLPKGVDLAFNTNKSDSGNPLDAMKPLVIDGATGKVDTDNPFGALTRQLKQDNGDGTKTVTSAMNLVNEEGQWGEWSKNLSSQMLSKQSPKLAKDQLAKTLDSRETDFNEIMALTNPTVRRKLLQEFSESTDSAAVHLKAAPLPGQSTHVILPIASMSDTQVYAPKFQNGEKVVLVRYPHGGIFEIPELTVNNRQPEAKSLLKDARDAIGINANVAERMSGADFDGDTVLVIPNDSRKVLTAPALEGLKSFNPRREYAAYEGMVPITPINMQAQMGKVSNLITDMTLQKAPASEVARAIRHSMVVIDAEKHNLDYKRSAQENGISQLKEKYQGGPTAGASTLISKAGAAKYIPRFRERKMSEGGPIDPKTGKKIYVETGESYIDKRTGKEVSRLTKRKTLAVTDDAFELSSGTPTERIYATHSNKLKALANKSRVEMLRTPRAVYSPSAKKAYAEEVASLDAQLDLALRNAPLERQAQLIANSTFNAKKASNPNMDATQEKREKFRSLDVARTRVGAAKRKIVITEPEWRAIQAGAVTDTKLSTILTNADMDVVRKLATPRPEKKMTASVTARAQALLDSGATRAEVAKAIGVSLTTLDEVTSAS